MLLGEAPPLSATWSAAGVWAAPAARSACSAFLGMEGTQYGGAARFSCPPNFTETPPAPEPPRFSLEALTGPDTELWLIQAPADFAPHCLDGRRVPLSGSQIVKGKLAGKRHRYQVLSSSRPQAGEATLLAPSAEMGGGLTCAPAPHGSLRIIEGPQESLSRAPLQPIPASPPPEIPPGLRPRFCAFGGSPPVTGPGSALALKSPRKRKKKRQVPEASATQEAVNGQGAPEVDTAWGSLEVDVGKKQQLAEPEVTEPAAELLEPLGALFLPTSKKRKKKEKPKGTETGEPEAGMLELDQPVKLEPVVQTEPPEATVLSPTKKRKRQKGTEGMEPVEGTTVDYQQQAKEDPQGEAIPLPPIKKKKKEKKRNMMMGPEMQLPGEKIKPELPDEVETQAAAAPVSPKKRKRKEKCQNVMLEPEAGAMEPGLPDDLEPQAAVTSTKKKKERGHKVTEPWTEVTGPPRETMESEAGAALGSTKKRKKQGEESGVPEMVPDPEAGEAAPMEGPEKRKTKL